MEALIFILLICSTNLVFSDDNVAIESGVGYQVHASPEENGPKDDQLAESSQIVTHRSKEGQNVRQSDEVSETLNYSDKAHLNRNGDVRYTYQVQNVHQQPEPQALQYVQENITHRPIVVNQGGVHSVQGQAYSHQQQHMGGQQYQSHHGEIYNAQASLPQQYYENEHTTGYQTYVEHVPDPDDEEIKSALKENSVEDLKRLVPKSGISFKLYHSEKAPNVKLTEHKIEVQPDVSAVHTQGSQKEHVNSVLHHRVRVQAPVQVQTSQTHLQSELGKPQQIYVQQTIGQHHAFGNHLPVTNAVHQEQNTGAQVYYTQHEATSPKTVVYAQPEISSSRPVIHAQPEISSPRPVVYTQTEVSSPRPVIHTQHEISSPRPVAYAHAEVTSPRPIIHTQPEINSPRPIVEVTGKGTVDAHYKVKLRNDHAKATSTAEFNRNVASGGHRQESNHLRHQQSRNNFYKALKQVKPENVQYQKELTEGIQKLALSQSEGLSGYVTHEGADAHADALKGSVDYATQEVSAQDQLLHSKTFADLKTSQPILNRLSGTYITEGVNSGSALSHLAAGAYTESQHISTQSNYGNLYLDNEAAKAHSNAVHYQTQFDGKSSPNNFDHQKALEGSTSFDIKNAIGNTEEAEVHTGYVSTTEIHPTEELQKQQLLYSLQSIPSVPSVLVENSILKTPSEGHQIKAIGQVASIPHFASHPQEIVGKFYRQPHFVWASEHLKQGNEIHQPLLKLHFPKEEIQYLKTTKVEIPSVVTHQHQPLVTHQNALYKPHELHFQQHKKYPQSYQSNLKLSQPLIIDWSLFKSKYPNVNINSLVSKPELVTYLQEPSKKIMPILVRKRKNRSNKKEVGVVYGKTSSRGPVKPSQRQEKNVHVNLLPSASNDVNKYESKDDRKNEFSVSASYKVDRSYKNN